MDALSNARANADRMRVAAKAAVAVAPRVLSANSGGVPYTSPNLGKHSEQYRHYTGWVYTCVKAMATKIAGQQVCVAKAAARPRSKRGYTDALKPLDTHPLLDLLADPNDIMVRWSLLFSVAASMLLTGKGFLWFPDSSRDDRDFDCWPIPATWLSPSDQFRNSWTLRPFGGVDSFEVAGERIAYFPMIDPSNPFEATSPLTATSLAVSADESIQEAQSRLFSSGMWPGLAVIAGQEEGGDGPPLLDQSQKDQILISLERMYRGASRFGGTIILDALIRDIKKISNTPQEMDFLDSGKQTKDRIFLAYGVNAIVAGQVEGANRASSTVASEHFADQVNPLCELISQVLTAWTGPLFGGGLEIWIDPVRVNDPEQTLREYEVGLQQGTVTPNEYRQRILGLPPLKSGGDTPYASMISSPRT